MDFPSIFNNGVSPVETQNLASPVPDSSINVACSYSPNLHFMRLPSRDCAVYHAYNHSRDLHHSLVRRKILRLYFFRQRMIIWSFPPIFNNGASPVETQNLASPVLDSSINVACSYSPNLHSMCLTSRDCAVYHACNYSRN